MKQIQTLEDALNSCQAKGMRLSRQRRYILELLWEVKEHLSAKEIYNKLNQEGKAIGYTSVYQNLEALSRQGIVECIKRADCRLYGHLSDSHSHINCLDTGEIVDVYLELPPELIQQIEERSGVKISDYRVDLYGYRLPESPANKDETPPQL